MLSSYILFTRDGHWQLINIATRWRIGQLIAIFLSVNALASCNKLVEVTAPADNINAANVYSTDATAAAVLTGLYTKMSSENNFNFDRVGNLSTIYIGTGLSSDELTLLNVSYSNFNLLYKNELTSINAPAYWEFIYPDIFTINSAIEGINGSNSLTPGVKNRLLGEAKFLRAFNYFYLVNLYGDVPLAISTDYKVNSELTRTPVSKVYDQIVADLKDAQLLLNDEYVAADIISIVGDRVRPNKPAATALLARVYLYLGSQGNTTAFTDAEAEATQVINNTDLYDTVALEDVFLKNSREAIWQLQPVGADMNSNTGEGKFFVLPAMQNLFTHPVYLSKAIVSSFEMGDLRKVEWVGTVNYDGTEYSFPNKYKIGQGVSAPPTEYSTILRLAEQYLIRAEARAHLGNFLGAQEDLNVIRKRVGLPNTTAADETSLLAAIERERKLELFTEGGHRWFDLKRTARADAVLGPVKAPTWQSTDELYPIPSTEIAKSPRLQGHQNPGYQ